jgi:hypothetical protein
VGVKKRIPGRGKGPGRPGRAMRDGVNVRRDWRREQNYGWTGIVDHGDALVLRSGGVTGSDLCPRVFSTSGLPLSLFLQVNEPGEKQVRPADGLR